MPMSGGTLFVVATPIGNLGDLTPRARETLAAVDLIAAEDTRHTGRLLKHFDIATPMLALHEHNEAKAADVVMARLREGADVALVSDAGTPLVSDPGFVLVRAARGEALDVRAVPGACAAVAALSVAGLPSDRFVFEGFLPSRPGARRRRLQALAVESRTLILYESGHRLLAAAADLAECLGEQRRVCVARELTKQFEESALLAAGELEVWLRAEPNRGKGEFVLVVAGCERDRGGTSEHAIRLPALMAELARHMPLKEAARTAARLTGVSRNEAYRAGLESGDDDPR